MPEGERDAWIGPFLVERRRLLGGRDGVALLQGISLEGVIWSAGRGDLPGLPLVLAGEQALLSEEALPGRVRLLHLNLDPSRSNLPASPDWPILLANLVEHVRARLPGPPEVNVRIGEEIALRFAGTPEQAAAHVLRDPVGGAQRARGWTWLTWEARHAGIHRLVRGETDVAHYAVNFVDPIESDLTAGTTLDVAASEAVPTAAQATVQRGGLEGRVLALLLLLFIALDWFVLGRRS